MHTLTKLFFILLFLRISLASTNVLILTGEIDGDLKVYMSFNKRRVSLNEVVTLQIVFNGVFIKPPDTVLSLWEDKEITDLFKVYERYSLFKESSDKMIFKYELEPRSTGLIVFPSLWIRYRSTNGNYGIVKTVALPLEVVGFESNIKHNVWKIQHKHPCIVYSMPGYINKFMFRYKILFYILILPLFIVCGYIAGVVVQTFAKFYRCFVNRIIFYRYIRLLKKELLRAYEGIVNYSTIHEYIVKILNVMAGIDLKLNTAADLISYLQCININNNEKKILADNIRLLNFLCYGGINICEVRKKAMSSLDIERIIKTIFNLSGSISGIYNKKKNFGLPEIKFKYVFFAILFYFGIIFLTLYLLRESPCDMVDKKREDFMMRKAIAFFSTASSRVEYERAYMLFRDISRNMDGYLSSLNNSAVCMLMADQVDKAVEMLSELESVCGWHPAVFNNIICAMERMDRNRSFFYRLKGLCLAWYYALPVSLRLDITMFLLWAASILIGACYSIDRLKAQVIKKTAIVIFVISISFFLCTLIKII